MGRLGYAAGMDAPLARLCPSPSCRATAAQFLRFGLVGSAGFVIDTAVVYTLRAAVGLYVAGLISYIAAATGTWFGNRAWTFRAQTARSRRAAHRQWAVFLGVNLGGFCLNRGAYFTLITYSPFCRAWPAVAVAAGALAGMALNFTLSRRVVFR